MKRYCHITDFERDCIATWKAQGVSNKKIAQRLGRDKTTIGREITRNSFKEKQYIAIHAKNKAHERQTASKKRHPLKNPHVYAYVIDKLRQGWSPEQIAGWAERQSGHQVISYETIYQFIYSDHPEAQRLELWKCLPRKQKRRRAKGGRGAHRVRIPDRVSIHQRPEYVEKRDEFGHWEADTVIGTQKQGAVIHTEVERKTRYTKARVISSKSAGDTIHAQMNLLNRTNCKSITMDNGLEFALHTKLNKQGIQTYFADPYSSWQRGTNEYHNGLLRRYLPKKHSFANLYQDELDDIVEEINRRPRKCLGYTTPYELYHKELGVAL